MNDRVWSGEVAPDYGIYTYSNYIPFYSNEGNPVTGTNTAHLIIDQSSSTTLTTVGTDYAQAPEGCIVVAFNATSKLYLKMSSSWVELAGGGGTIQYFGDADTNGSWRIRVNSSNGRLEVQKRVAGSWSTKGDFR